MMTPTDAHAHVTLAGLESRGLRLCPWPMAVVRAGGLDENAQAAVLPGNAERELRRVRIAGGRRG